ncbi:T9SS type A sorting domain-containing protein [Flexithrix dorotheae]|uniref:T9SS type A sorting domain-containing protein n=1 Tax=Flexithrix dorotheae TaxID=70993 RepID=UPI00035E9BB6|nr:T9SS type A sorting domain-containing protein [Flexithrix dorotheae]
MQKQTLFFILLLSYSFHGFTQETSFVFYDSIEVSIGGESLKNAWAGGLNASQFSKVDLNGDGSEDLVVFDRTTQKLSTFLSQNNEFSYAPEYEDLFPKFQFWMLLVDYNCDGKKDLFFGTNSGITAYTNIAEEGENVAWELAKDPIKSTGFSGGSLTLKVDITDIPAIVDIDNDGDLDILNFIPTVGGRVEYHKNLSMENFGNCDNLEFQKITNRWGDFEECGTCDSYIFGNETSCRVAKTNHAGSALLALDMDDDGDKDLILGEVSCNHLVYFENKGDENEAVFDSAILDIPITKPVNFHVFPASFYEDVDFDGKNDLLVSPNLFSNDAGFMTNFSQSNWYYKNIGTNAIPEFNFEKKDFLQNEMIDLGEGASPAMADADGDGDLDLFVANKGDQQSDSSFYATIKLFENTGSDLQPAFELNNVDYLGLSQLNFIEIKPQFADLNNDGKTDFVFTALVKNTSDLAIRYMLNEAANPADPPIFQLENIQLIDVDIERLDEAHFADLDNDNDMDLLLGKNRGGELIQYENTGDLNFTKVRSAAGGIGFDNTKRELSLDVADMDGDDLPDLITGDRSGEFKVYTNFIEDLDGTFTAIENLFFNNTLGKNIQHHFGSGIFPIAYEKNLIIGSEAGGLTFLKNKSIVSGIDDPKVAFKVQVFPNPAKNSFKISSAETLSFQIFDLLGRTISKPQVISPDSEVNIQTEYWVAGLYLIKFQKGNYSFSEKIIIKK